MKKILEVLQYGEMDIRFNTDVNVKEDHNVVTDVLAASTYSMSTTLWGSNEQSVLAMIRALSIADLACSVNRDYMIKFLDKESRRAAEAIDYAFKQMNRDGAEVTVFPPFINPSKGNS